MGHFAVYAFISGLVLLASYIVYKWLLSAENQPGFNRIILLTIYVLSFAVFPLTEVISSADPYVAPDIALGEISAAITGNTANGSAASSFVVCLLWIYLTGMIATALWTVAVAIRIHRIIASGERHELEDCILVTVSRPGIAPFSYGRYVVMSIGEDPEGARIILCHERAHIACLHFADLLLAQVVCILLWYNPAAWLMLSELKSVHEYQADSHVLAGGVNCRQYQLLLIKKTVGVRFPSLANSLNHSKLKKRITMMYNPKTSASRRLRVLALAPAFAAAVLVTDIPAVAGAIDSASGASLSAVMPAEAVAAVTESKVTKNTSAGQPGLSGRQDAAVAPASDKKVRTKNLEEIVVVGYGTAKKTSTPEAGRVNGNACDGEEMGFDVVDEAPEYPGGQVELMKFIAKNIRYPHDAMKDSIEGNVVVRFIVGNDGKVSSPEIVRGVCPSIDAEALRVVSSLPALKPARMKGKPVELWYNLPIAFRLTGNDRKKLIASIGTNSSRGMVAVELNGDEKDVTFIVDGVRVESIRDIDQSTIERVNVWKDETSPLYVKYKTPIVEIILKK
ncbi:M56 family metallopeptidase [uncultured Duncaniella sp.]|uniref:M56 family metallopeptidase n=1 Tax=uncultured Duncaniella sp. TaxID=2768039 RepID=UPI002664F910|nr:M56 family metallopeptidase [uncultured Duncaniella sp.]